MSRAVSTVRLSDDPECVSALSEHIRNAPKRLTLAEASEVIEVLDTLEQVRVWCRRRAGLGENDG